MFLSIPDFDCNVCGFLAEKCSMISQNSFLPVRRNLSKIYLRLRDFFAILNRFRSPSEKPSAAGFSKLHSISPEDAFRGKSYILRFFFKFQSFPAFWLKIFGGRVLKIAFLVSKGIFEENFFE